MSSSEPTSPLTRFGTASNVHSRNTMVILRSASFRMIIRASVSVSNTFFVFWGEVSFSVWSLTNLRRKRSRPRRRNLTLQAFPSFGRFCGAITCFWNFNALGATAASLVTGATSARLMTKRSTVYSLTAALPNVNEFVGMIRNALVRAPAVHHAPSNMPRTRHRSRRRRSHLILPRRPMTPRRSLSQVSHLLRPAKERDLPKAASRAEARVWSTARGATSLIRELRGLCVFTHLVASACTVNIPTLIILSGAALVPTNMGISRFVLGRRTRHPLVAKVANGAMEIKAPRARRVTSTAGHQRRVKNPTQIHRPNA